MTETPTGKKLSERFEWGAGQSELENGLGVVFSLLPSECRVIADALRLSEPHSSAIREAVEGAKREERESCAKLLERLVPDRHGYVKGYDAAVAIRARGKEKGQ